MKFDIKKPCSNCPFIEGGIMNQTLAEGRLEGIIEDLRNHHTFACHKTLYSRERGHCAGALIFLEREAKGDMNENQLLQIAQRLGLYDPTTLEMDYPGLVQNADFPRTTCHSATPSYLQKNGSSR